MGKHNLNANTCQNHKHLRIDKREKKNKKRQKIKGDSSIAHKRETIHGPNGPDPVGQ